MRKSRRTDGNHAEIRTLLRDLACIVEDTSDVGRGFPDLVVKTIRGSVFMVEVKNGKQPANKQQLSDDEKAFALRWGAIYVVVKNADEAIALARR